MIMGGVLSLLIGPVFFALLQTSIEKGFRAGGYMAIGIFLSDSIYIYFTYFSLSQLIDSDNMKMGLGLGGGLIMLVFGIYNLFLKKVDMNPPAGMDYSRGRYFGLKQISKGFALNGINPFVLLFWVGMVGMVNINYEYGKNEAITFFAGILLVVFCMDILKSYLANRLRKWLKPELIKWLNRVVGVLLIAFALRLFYYAMESYWYFLAAL